MSSVTGAIIGTCFGLSTKLGSNLMQRVPLMRHPWEHLLCMGIGASAGAWAVKKNKKNEEEVKELLEYLNRPAVERKHF